MAALLLITKIYRKEGRRMGRGGGRRKKREGEKKGGEGRGTQIEINSGWINELWYIHTMKYYTAVKKND